MLKKIKFLSLAGITLSFSSLAESNVQQTKIEQNTQTYSVGLSTTRIIYKPGSQGASVTINNPNDFPVLAQSEVTADKKDGRSVFTVTPPLFRLDPNQQSRIRIIMTGKNEVTDRETLNWLCVTGIPPEKGDVWDERNETKENVATLDVKVKLRQCIKLFTRPDGLKGTPDSAGENLKWQKVNGGIKAENNSAYYVNLKSITVGGKKLDFPEYIEPFSNKIFKVSEEYSSGKEGSYTVINDLGGDNKPYTMSIQ